ncbi:MAG: helix-turn-helix domain-containing protein [Oscillospiraceae bacterium]|nr:helix-turn-helix domain-containing protein [Oscillospiraceae bacterium]
MDADITYDRGIFADNLQRLMRAHRERQVDVARLLGVSKSTVSAYCSGAQMPRMDKIEQLAHHYGVSRAALIGGEAPVEVPAAPAQAEAHKPGPAEQLYNVLNDAGQAELLRYGRYLSEQPEFRAAQPRGQVTYIKHYLTPAAAGYASPIEGEDYELLPRDLSVPAGADFCITVRGDSMAPWIPDGSLVYVRRDAPLREFEAGVFFVDGDVYCKQWCVDYAGTLHLLSANPARQDANLRIPRDSGRSCVCFGKVLLAQRLPRPTYAF